MNYKLEKFWNNSISLVSERFFQMNYKLEKFWNRDENGEYKEVKYNEL